MTISDVQETDLVGGAGDFLASRTDLIGYSQQDDSIALRDAIHTIAMTMWHSYGVATDQDDLEAGRKRLFVGSNPPALSMMLFLERFGCLKVRNGSFFLLWNEVRRICD